MWSEFWPNWHGFLADAAFAWIKCENEEDKDSHAVLREAKIIGRAGHVFGVERRYVRLSLVNSQDDFDLLQHRLEMLVFQERMVNLMARINLGGDATRKNSFSRPLNATSVTDKDARYHCNRELAFQESTSLLQSTKNFANCVLIYRRHQLPTASFKHVHVWSLFIFFGELVILDRFFNSLEKLERICRFVITCVQVYKD